ncbi:MAG: fibronectin type III-like domain-contianing protein, partial [Spirochaetales bacterium]|nr:fibronectin type III-like domain-contianing protein [Spirochaetales bacterium]
KTNPSGKLATTWACWKDYPQIGSFGDRNDTDYKEGIYVGYRYFDAASVTPLFPFGYGLSYTTFKTEPKPVELDGTKVVVEVDVTNTGKRSGKEVVQVYASSPKGRLDKCRKDLAGFAKTDLLNPGCTETVKVSFDMKDIASYDTLHSSFVLENGDYIVRVGTRSDMTLPIARIRLDEEAVVLKARPCCGKPDFEDWIPKESDEEIPDYIPVLDLKSTEIATKTVKYSVDYPIDDVVRKLDDSQLALANIGTFKEKGSLLSVIGSASSQVAGAAGQVNTRLEDAGFSTMVLADGPAGLRLIPKYYRDDKGAHGLDASSHSESFMQYMPKLVAWAMNKANGKSKPPKGSETKYQYCTAIPIGTAIAQSWNVKFAKLCGDIVGNEMELFGVHLWLAPALNIHRSILCGRNFEYYSEDPLVSGMMAAYITLGVQSHKGCGTTIKHYAANNQETNRYGNSSNVSERAMREIYLKGFGICVKLSQPKAVMTSYNLLNGKHTAERSDLIEDILRREFGFEGIVMTDWVIGNGIMNGPKDKYPKVKPQLTAAAGSDLFMPGCTPDFKNMLEGLESGEVSREQLQINATRVYRMGKELSGGKA